MDNPNSIKVNANDAINEYAKLNGMTQLQARDELHNYGFLDETIRIENIGNSKKTIHDFDLSKDGRRILQSGKTFTEYLKEEREKELKKIEKEKQDELHKNLQIKDLETKLNVMNGEQIEFWKAQKEKNVQTTILAIISVIFSLIALLKAFGFFS